jgi:putative N6-adenine-specific DNA methylase
VSLAADPAALPILNRQLRTASRVLVRIARFRASGLAELERKAASIPWAEILGRHMPGVPGGIRFEITSRKSRLYHTGAIEERLRRSLQAWAGERRLPPWPSEVPGPRFVVRVLRDRVTVSADASGEPLHRRGYRQAVAKAPLRETLAAALILASEWDATSPLFDPFCGSGTLVIEGALLNGRIAPGRHRRFSFEGWPGFEGGGSSVDGAPGSGGVPGVQDGARDARQGEVILTGSDRDAGAVEAARANARRAGVADRTSFHAAALSAAPFPPRPEGRGLLVTNPPYGRRVGDPERLRNLYGRLGALLRERWSGGRVVLLSPDPVLTGQLGLATRTLFRTRNGGVPVDAVAADVPSS